MKSFVHVAVIDDEFAMELLFQAFFEEKITNHDLKLSFFADARECLVFLDEVMDSGEQKVDLIFCDINMPLMNGFDFLDEVMKKFPKLNVHMMSGLESEDYKQTSQTKGAKGFHAKPFEFDELLKIVDGFVLE